MAKTINININEYVLTQANIHNLTEEFYGKVLQSSEKSVSVIDIEFAQDDFAEQFANVLNSENFKLAKPKRKSRNKNDE